MEVPLKPSLKQPYVGAVPMGQAMGRRSTKVTMPLSRSTRVTTPTILGEDALIVEQLGGQADHETEQLF